MTQHFIESKTKGPQLFCFSQTLEENIDYSSLLNKIQEDFDNWQNKNWLKYWNTEGEPIILQTWNEKYKDYLKNEEINLNEPVLKKDSKEGYTDDIESKEVVELTPDSQTSLDDEYLNSWNDLWDQHREEIYLEQYLIYTTIFYNYYLEFKNSVEQPLPIQEEFEEEDNANYSIHEYTQVSEDLEQLKLLGLPTSFGGRPQNSSKKSKHQRNNLHFSDFFSESDTENASSESEMEIEDNPSTTLPVVEDEDSAEMEMEDNPSTKLSAVEGENSAEMEDNPSTTLPAVKGEDSALHGVDNKVIAKVSQKTKKKNRKLKNVPSFILEEKGLLKYWRKRFSLFSRFDEGIRLDRESWFSVTPEKVAKHMAERLRGSIIVDGFCGSGGNAIQFALTCDKVIAIDIDPVKLEMAKHNAQIYNVSHKIEFILGDFLQLASSGKLKADIVFLSPPWGGPKYKNKKDYDIEKYLIPVKASELVDVARLVSHNVALFLPRNSNVKQIIRLAGVGKRCEIEHNYLDSRLVAITALYGEEILQKKTPTN